MRSICDFELHGGRRGIVGKPLQAIGNGLQHLAEIGFAFAEAGQRPQLAAQRDDIGAQIRHVVQREDLAVDAAGAADLVEFLFQAGEALVGKGAAHAGVELLLQPRETLVRNPARRFREASAPAGRTAPR